MNKLPEIISRNVLKAIFEVCKIEITVHLMWVKVVGGSAAPDLILSWTCSLETTGRGLPNSNWTPEFMSGYIKFIQRLNKKQIHRWSQCSWCACPISRPGFQHCILNHYYLWLPSDNMEQNSNFTALFFSSSCSLPSHQGLSQRGHCQQW